MLTARQMIIALATKHNGDWAHMFTDIQSRNMSDLEQYARDERAITILDSAYPEILKHDCYQSPMVLFYKGDITLLGAKDSIAIFGSRQPKGENEIFTDAFIRGLTSGRVIITGLAQGIQSTAILSALETGKKVIAVLGSGIDYCYPACNKDLYDRIIAEGGLILSEYPFDTQPSMEKMPYRNRIITSLASHVCSIETQIRSGTMVALEFAMQQNKDIYVKPDPSDPKDVNNRLIDNGAYCLTLATSI